MDAEILCFMTEKDQEDFFREVQKHCDEINLSTLPMQLVVGDCRLLFTPTKSDNETLYCGKLEIRLGPSDSACNSQERAKKVFRKLRNWIKKGYWSRLAYLNQNKKGKLTPSRNHWLGPDAKRWKELNPDKHILQLSKTSWMTFDIGF